MRWSPSCAARLGDREADLRAALDLVDGFPGELRSVVKREWDKNPNADSRTQIMIPLLRHTNYVADFVEKHLAHGTRRELSEALVDELHREMDELGLGQYGVVISHGEAYNFTTTYGDLRRRDFRSAAFKARRTRGVGSTLCVLQDAQD